MDQFVTTYQKDYTWPTRKSLPALKTPRKGGPCSCGIRSSDVKKVSEPCQDGSFEWSRLGPMGRLLDPKLHPAKTGPYPENESTKFDQPSTYLKKLEEKHPNLYGILQSASVKEIKQRVDVDRMKTTYQMDYSDKDESYMQPCAPVHVVEEDCRPQDRPKIPKRPEVHDKDKKGKRSGKKGEDMEGQETRLPAWRSEYQDNIGRIGQAVMKTKIHQRQKNSPMLAMTN